MANPNRKMVTLRRIDDVQPIDGADRIELAVVGGWNVVVKKGEFKAGDIAIYHEIDSFLDTTRPEYSFLDATRSMVIDGKEVMGHVLRTRRMRGVYSQGLLIDPRQVLDLPDSVIEELCNNRADLSKAFGVVEYYKPMVSPDFISRYDPYVAPRTDAERIQNISQDTWDLAKRTEYFVSVKVDGTSITMVYDERVNRLRIFSHNNEFDITKGMGKLAYDCAVEQGLVDFCLDEHNITLQMELCGPKINGNRLALERPRLFVFSVWDMERKRYDNPYEWLPDDNPKQSNLVPSGVASIDGFETPKDFLEYVDGLKGSVTKGRLDEGMVVHILEQGDLNDDEWQSLRLELSDQLQIKAVSNKYLLKAGE